MSDVVTGAADDLGAAALVERVRDGDVAALARAITIVENEAPSAAAILRAVDARPGRVPVVGITGPPGVGKSTLIDTYVAELRRRGQTVGVLAIDPSSPLTGGAILGDRIRMARHMDDSGVYIRSLASRGALGGLSRTAAAVLRVMAAAKPDVIVIETVGAGQSDIEIDMLAHVKLVVSAPGLGDGVQAIKAGILEIADVLVVNKSDLPGAEDTVRQLQAMVQLRPRHASAMSVIAVSSVTGAGLADLADLIARHNAERREGGGHLRTRASLAAAVRQSADSLLRGQLDAAEAVLDALCERVERGEIDAQVAARLLLDAVLDAGYGSQRDR
jgi:LAO/AO transport system kinase